MDHAKVIDVIAGFMESEGAPLAVAGAFALHAYGLSRATVDIDFVAEAEVRERLVTFLESIGYETLHSSPGYSNHLHPDARLGRVDFIYVSGETARRVFAAREVTLRFGQRVLRVPRAEHLIAMKVHAMKNDPSRSLQEMADIRYLLQVPGVDQEEIRSYFAKADMLDKYDEIKQSL
jgi:hypothetical protein